MENGEEIFGQIFSQHSKVYLYGFLQVMPKHKMPGVQIWETANSAMQII
jgi:hypothetical protein